MKQLALISVILFVLSSCRTEYEKLRLSNDPQQMYKSAGEYFEAEEYYKAQTLYETVIPYYRGKKEAEDIYYKFAYTHYHLKEYILSSHYFKNFANTFYSSPNREEADFLAAFSKYKMSPNYRLDQSSSTEAIDAFQLFANTYPDSDRVAECNEYIDDLRKKLEEKAYEEGKLYYDLKRYNSAIQSFENMLKDFPESPRSEEIRFLILKANYVWSENSIYEKKVERFEDCLKKYEIFTKKYPESEYADEAKKIHEKSLIELNKLEDGRLKNASAKY